MARTGVVVDERCLKHDTGRGHPERPERLRVLLDLVRQRQDEVAMVPARVATVEELSLVHDERHIERVAATDGGPGYAFDADTPASAGSYTAARVAAGSVLALLDEIMAGRVDNGFAFVRPPGHHAERDRAMGFCLFNNVAIGAQYLRQRHGVRRVLIVDWDLHHGNGTQHIFEQDPDVLYVSLHQYPHYPGTGAVSEVGVGEGEGKTLNLPLPAGFGDAEYREAFRRVIEPVAREFEPEFVLISAGFDCHVRDPLGGMQVTEHGFRAMARTLLGVARASAGGRCAAVLEGGYDLKALSDSASGVLDEMRGSTVFLPAVGPSGRALPVLEAVRRVHSAYWKSLACD